MRVAGIVLRGGQSRRMGQPKAWLPFGGETMLARVVRILGGVVDPIVVVASPDADALASLLAADGVTLTSTEPGRFEVRGVTADAIGDIAAGNKIRLHELAPIEASLESAYHELTRDSVEYAAA